MTTYQIQTDYNREIRDREIHTRIILVHSIPELHPVLSQTTEYSTM